MTEQLDLVITSEACVYRVLSKDSSFVMYSLEKVMRHVIYHVMYHAANVASDS